MIDWEGGGEEKGMFFAESFTFVINRDKFKTAYKMLRIEKKNFFLNIHKYVNFWSVTATVQSTQET